MCLEPTRSSFLELYRRVKMDYADVVDRVVLLPAAAALDPHTPCARSRATSDSDSSPSESRPLESGLCCI